MYGCSEIVVYRELGFHTRSTHFIGPLKPLEKVKKFSISVTCHDEILGICHPIGFTVDHRSTYFQMIRFHQMWYAWIFYSGRAQEAKEVTIKKKSADL